MVVEWSVFLCDILLAFLVNFVDCIVGGGPPPVVHWFTGAVPDIVILLGILGQFVDACWKAYWAVIKWCTGGGILIL